MAAAQKQIGPEPVQLFNYQASSQASATPDWQGWGGPSESTQLDPNQNEQSGTQNETDANAGFAKRLAEETRRSFEAGRERGRQEGLQTEREAHAAAQRAVEQRQLRQSAGLIETFAQERDRYLHAVEQEVVKLALAVAARILRREAQMDPLLLAGAVRVALGQLSGSTEVRLQVPPGDIELWSEAISLIPNLALKPTVIAAEGMRLGDCVVETSMGSVDLGVRSQLGEIERGFFDRAGSPASRPQSKNPLSSTTSETSQ
ncbi:MAG TPA: FliH/SctL family protein [Isosphaeraceae bacterium]|nr:FliH/SctL family protein [Isosphaeraceae bacterium]